MFESLNNKWEFKDFVRQTDRLISQQKSEIRELLSYSIDKVILKFVESQFKKDKINNIYFELKEISPFLKIQDIYNIKIGYYE